MSFVCVCSHARHKPAQQIVTVTVVTGGMRRQLWPPSGQARVTLSSRCDSAIPLLNPSPMMIFLFLPGRNHPPPLPPPGIAKCLVPPCRRVFFNVVARLGTCAPSATRTISLRGRERESVFSKLIPYLADISLLDHLDLETKALREEDRSLCYVATVVFPIHSRDQWITTGGV